MRLRLTETLGKIADMTESLHAATEEIAVVGRHSQSQILSQGSNIEQIEGAIEELSTSVDLIRQRIDETSSATHQAYGFWPAGADGSVQTLSSVAGC